MKERIFIYLGNIFPFRSICKALVEIIIEMIEIPPWWHTISTFVCDENNID